MVYYHEWHTHIYQLTRYVLFMFDYYIWPVRLYCSVSSTGEVSENGHFGGIQTIIVIIIIIIIIITITIIIHIYLKKLNTLAR